MSVIKGQWEVSGEGKYNEREMEKEGGRERE